MVTLKSSAGRAAEIAPAIAATYGGRVVRSWSRALNGFVIEEINEEAASLIASHSDVAMVEQDSEMTITVDSQYVGANSGLWGLDRVDQRSSGGDGYYRYQFDAPTVHIYIVDTGVDEHSDIQGRLGSGWGIEGDTDDCHGHGTAMASLAAGTTFGIAKDATIHPVRVTDDCGGTVDTSDVISGIDWVADNHSNPAVLNLSIANGGTSSTLDAAATGAIAEGAILVAAAGDENTSACNNSPTRVSSVIAVAASSNYGSCVDLFAPGVGIAHAALGGGSISSTGVSISTALVSGTAALIKAQDYFATQSLVELALTSSATADSLSSIGSGSPNKLLYAPHTYSYMDGPVLITSAGNYTWTAKRWGGLSTYTYLWEISFDGSYYSTVGSSQSYVRYVDDCENFYLRVSIDSGDEVNANFKYVQPNVEPCPQ
jgi:serine protease